MIAFIDDHRGAHGVEPICKVLPIAPSTYHAHVAKRRDPATLSARARQDAALKIEVRRVFDENFRVYGVRKVWRQLKREGFDVARCTVARLMRDVGLQGVIRGKPVKTTISDKAAPCPLDHVNRQFRAPRPNVLWLSDFTYVATWSGFVYVAFVIDAYARRIVGWRASRTAHAGFVLDALEQALHDRRPVHRGGLVHHSDRGSQYVSIKYTERLAEAGVEPSVGSVGDSYDNALAETINGLYKAEVIHRRGPWRNFEAVEFATLEWVDWFNNRRLLEPIGNATTDGSWSLSATSRRPKPSNATTPCWNNPPWRHNLNQMASGKPGAVQTYSRLNGAEEQVVRDVTDANTPMAQAEMLLSEVTPPTQKARLDPPHKTLALSARTQLRLPLSLPSTTTSAARGPRIFLHNGDHRASRVRSPEWEENSEGARSYPNKEAANERRHSRLRPDQ